MGVLKLDYFTVGPISCQDNNFAQITQKRYDEFTPLYEKKFPHKEIIPFLKRMNKR
jgi:hypothetical protein